MSLAFAVLGSGSSGNCTLLRLRTGAHERCILIDCGLSPRQTLKRMQPFGVQLDDISDIILTHLDRDHFYNSWTSAIERFDITLHVHHRHARALMWTGTPMSRVQLFEDGFELGNGAQLIGVLLAHDQLGTVGYVVEHDGMRMGYATDLGCVPDALLDTFTDLHALAIESNYCPRMQAMSNRPAFLKRRITGGAGHLSNQQALDAVLAVAERSALSHVALLHLSRQCNDPNLVQRIYAHRAPGLLERLTITSQTRATPLLRIHRHGERHHNTRIGEQLAMF